MYIQFSIQCAFVRFISFCCAFVLLRFYIHTHIFIYTHYIYIQVYIVPFTENNLIDVVYNIS